MTTKTDEQERTAFETWAKGADMPLGMYNATDYTDGATQLSWDGWQAGRAAMRERPAMPADAVTVPAYRLLGAGEIIQVDDEFIADDGVTWSAAGTGIWAGMPYTHVLKTARRRIEGES